MGTARVCETRGTCGSKFLIGARSANARDRGHLSDKACESRGIHSSLRDWVVFDRRTQGFAALHPGLISSVPSGNFLSLGTLSRSLWELLEPGLISSVSSENLLSR